MTRAVVPADLAELVRAVGAALDGDGPPVAPVPVLADADPGDAALVLRTSGSTGSAREVALSASALRASGEATHSRLGGPGHWLLTLPATHVAGVQVVARAHAGHGLTAAPAGEPFTADGFAALVRRAQHDGRRYASLVPTQLHRLVVAAESGADGGARGLDALCSLDAVLLGGATTPTALLHRARAAGARVVTTYGMTETCGGCVYDGVPLPGVRVRLARGSGVVELSGPVLAEGYLGDDAATAAAFRTDADGSRWFGTSDLGRITDDDPPRLTVLGRADDVVVTGGVNVAPAAVEDVVAGVEGVGEVCVVGVPDPEWGQAVVAVVTLQGQASSELSGAIRRRVADRLGRAAAPRRVLVVTDLPRRGPGKVDRAAVARLAVGHDGA
ncbi:AMP-binding protein [Cellulosimicrobium sp. Marseille-Q4280]|uniref:AMP-binding protein n=1 Tax=Cellulosimicrobium sp. Marseille-Q4280 TaxID=2937992 RepID=UPI002040453E|nr:AMP-binding protein [Cellulosimicrobium sp. Marseille-Q4280]